MNIAQLLRAQSTLKSEIQIETAKIIREETLLEDDAFWALTKDLKKQIKSTTFGVKSGIHNFFCDILEVDCMVRYVKTYNNKVCKVANDDSIWEHLSQYTSLSDDGWHDFTDSLPLQGKEFYEAVIDGSVDTSSDYVKNYPENYICMRLEEKLIPRLREYGQEPVDHYEHREQDLSPLEIVQQELKQERLKSQRLQADLEKIKQIVA